MPVFVLTDHKVYYSLKSSVWIFALLSMYLLNLPMALQYSEFLYLPKTLYPFLLHFGTQFWKPNAFGDCILIFPMPYLPMESLYMKIDVMCKIKKLFVISLVLQNKQTTKYENVCFRRK